jgi:uncharacterized protein (UPF0210 family)
VYLEELIFQMILKFLNFLTEDTPSLSKNVIQLRVVSANNTHRKYFHLYIFTTMQYINNNQIISKQLIILQQNEHFSQVLIIYNNHTLLNKYFSSKNQ